MWKSSFLVKSQLCRLLAGNFTNKWTPSQQTLSHELCDCRYMPPHMLILLRHGFYCTQMWTSLMQAAFCMPKSLGGHQPFCVTFSIHLSVTIPHHISETVHHVIIIFDTRVKWWYFQVFSLFFQNFYFLGC